MRALFRQGARLARIERLGRRIADIGLGNAALETVRRAVGPEANDGLLDLAGREQAHIPPIRRIEIAAREIGERASATAFELDVVLRVAVVTEACGDAGVGGRETITLGHHFAL